MPKKVRFVARPASHAINPTDPGNTVYKLRMNTRAIYPITAVTASALQLLYGNGLPGASDANYPASLEVQSSIRLFTGATGQGVGFTAPGTLSIPKGTRLYTAVMGLTATAAQTVQVCTYSAVTSGKVPNTTYSQSTWGLEHGDSLTPNLDGTLAASNVGWPSNNTGNHPIGLVGLTNTKGIANIGHSLTGGVGDTYQLGYAQRAAAILNIACFNGGTSGSGPSGWAGSDKGGTDLADVVVSTWMINVLNSQADSSADPATVVAAQTTAMANIIADWHAMGKRVVLTTEGFTGDKLQVDNVTVDVVGTARRTAMRAAWNAAVRANGVSVMGADLVFDVSPYLDATLDSNTPNTAITNAGDIGDKIHWGATGHLAVGTALAAALQATTWLGEDSAIWVQGFREDFWGGATSGGANFGRWTQWQSTFSPTALYRTADGRLGILSEANTTLSNLLYDSSSAGTQGMLEMYGTFAPQTGAFQGYGLAFVLTSATEGGGNRLKGYYAYMAQNGNLYIQTNNGSLTNPQAIAISGGVPATGRGYRLTFERVNNVSGGCDLVAKVYFGGSLTPKATATVTNDTTSDLGQASMYPAVAWMGDSVNQVAAQADVLDYVNYYTYNPYTITGITPNVTTDTVAGNGTATYTATVAGTGSFPAACSWRISSGGGSITPLGVFTAPVGTSVDQTIVVECASAGRDATATITITVPGTSTITSVEIDQGPTAQVLGEATLDLSATVEGTSGFSSDVTWSKLSGAGSVDASTGLYTAPGAGQTDKTSVIQVESDQDPSKTDTISITTPAQTSAGGSTGGTRRRPTRGRG